MRYVFVFVCMCVSVCSTVCLHMRMWFSVCCAVHRLLVSTMSDMSISNIHCCSVGEHEAAAVMHISPSVYLLTPCISISVLWASS